MCGLAGFYTKNKVSGYKAMNTMLEAIKHRGPDAKSVEIIDDMCFGHVRLSIIDIEHGKQPVKSSDGRFTLILNGEIYNYVELRQQLVDKGYMLKTHSDSEVLLYMYIAYGKKALNYINGMFVFAVYDNKEKTLFLARDHFGVKPIYYFQNKNFFVFASEIKAILKHPAVNTAPDMDSVYEYVILQFVMGKDTFFKNIYKLEPAHYMIVKEGQIIEKKEYWDFHYDIDDSKTKEEYVNELLLLLENSVMLQMRSDVPFGVYLSGGLDSSTVAALASKNYTGKLKTFSGGFKKPQGYDETKYARIVSEKIKSEHFEIFPTHQDFLKNFEKLVYIMDEPCAGPGLFPQYMVSKEASKHVKVVLGGQGGDEIFGGYARYSVAYLEQCLKGAIFETQEEGKHVVTLASIVPNLSLLKQYTQMIKKQFSTGLFDTMDRRYFNIINRLSNYTNIYNDHVVCQRFNNKVFEKFSKIFNKPKTKSYFNKMTYFDFKVSLPSLLHVEDRVGMSVSIETRVPLLDRRIVELAAKISPKLKFKNGKTKAIFIDTVKNILPHEITNRKDKMGFPVPLTEWFKGPLKDYVKDILLSKTAKKRGIYNTAKLEEILKLELQFDRGLWGLLCLETWFKTFIDK